MSMIREKKKTITGKLLVAVLLSTSIWSCQKNDGSNLDYRHHQSTTTTTTTTTSSTTTSGTTTTVSTSSYDLSKSLPSGYVTDGSVDYTSYVQSAINNNADVTFPAFPIMVNATGIKIPSNRTLSFLTGSQIILKATSNGSYDIFRIDNVTNVTLNNPVIIGDVGKHTGTSGEWGFGIGIYSSSNITLNGANISNCWGDGIYLGTSGGTITNSNIKIVNASVKGNRRDGISIISVNGLLLDAPYAGYSTGTDPMCGINFEPNVSTDELQNITINNAKTEYNGGFGIQVGYSNLYGGANKTSNITILNHTDYKSQVGFKASADITKRVGSETITGTLNITAPFWRQNPVAAITTDLYENNLQMNISKPQIEDINGNILTQAQTLSYLTYKTHINYGANYTITF